MGRGACVWVPHWCSPCQALSLLSFLAAELPEHTSATLLNSESRSANCGVGTTVPEVGI